MKVSAVNILAGHWLYNLLKSGKIKLLQDFEHPSLHKSFSIMNKAVLGPYLLKDTKTKPDVVFGLHFCSIFSTAKGNKNHFDKHPAFIYFKDMIDKIREISPPMAFSETSAPIKQFINVYSKKIAEMIPEYKIYYIYFNNLYLGIPQNRKRWLMIFTKYQIDTNYLYNLFNPPKKKILTVNEAIGDLIKTNISENPIKYGCPPQNEFQKKMRDGISLCYHHYPVYHNPQKIREVINICSRGFLNKAISIYDIAPTTFDTLVLKEIKRYITAREIARLMAIPDEIYIPEKPKLTMLLTRTFFRTVSPIVGEVCYKIAEDTLTDRKPVYNNQYIIIKCTCNNK